jgi:hypothetical protein
MPSIILNSLTKYTYWMGEVSLNRELSEKSVIVLNSRGYMRNSINNLLRMIQLNLEMMIKTLNYKRKK